MQLPPGGQLNPQAPRLLLPAWRQDPQMLESPCRVGWGTASDARFLPPAPPHLGWANTCIGPGGAPASAPGAQVTAVTRPPSLGSAEPLDHLPSATVTATGTEATSSSPSSSHGFLSWIASRTSREDRQEPRPRAGPSAGRGSWAQTGPRWGPREGLVSAAGFCQFPFVGEMCWLSPRPRRQPCSAGGDSKAT